MKQQRKLYWEIHDLAKLVALSYKHELKEARERTKRRLVNKKIKDILDIMVPRELEAERKNDNV